LPMRVAALNDERNKIPSAGCAASTALARWIHLKREIFPIQGLREDSMGRLGRTCAITTVVLAALGDAASAHASAFGLIGHSGKQGATCNECHGGGTAPTVAFSGPDTVAVGATVTYHFSVESARAAQRAAGFNVAVSGGQLAILPDQGEQVIGAELTHTAPKSNTDS